MKASVLFEQGKPLSVEELELEPPRTGEVLVRMAASGSVTRERAWSSRSAPVSTRWRSATT
jgi:Zn-dependent alcohol dehydrogenase